MLHLHVPFDTVSVIGLGYIGLPTAAMFASRGAKVIGVEVNPHVVETVNQGRIHIVEPELDRVVHEVVSAGALRATLTPEPADAFVIAVPTPFKGDHEPDYTYIEAASRAIAPVLARGNLVVLESTSPVGATEKMMAWIAEERPDLRMPGPGVSKPDLHVAHCPERVLPGQVVRELVENDRIIGGITPACSARARSLYRIFCEGELLTTSARTAELCKLTENSYRDVNIAFANELSVICHELDVEVRELISLANHHPRVNILQPGAGVGGHCIAVDPWFIVDSAPASARLIRTAREVNDEKPAWVLDRVEEALAHQASAKLATHSDLTVAVLGLAFKPNIDDLRESPALHIARELVDRTSARVIVVEPNVSSLPASLASAELVTLEEALVCADVVSALVAHREFSGLSEKLREGQALVDAVGVGRTELPVREHSVLPPPKQANA